MEKFFLLGVLLVAANCQVTPDRVWLFAVDGRRRPYSFIDPVGNLVGFDVDFIRAVCTVAGKKCSMVLAEFTECVYTHREITYPGPGLMSGWFDACPGYAITLDRQAAFDFTNPYFPSDASFTVTIGNPSNFDPSVSDFSPFVITHLTGAATNSRCLNRLNKKYNKIIVAADLPDAKGLLLNNTAQVLFSPRSNIPGLDVLPLRVSCGEGGTGMMMKKGSGLKSWWNPAFESFRATGAFAQLCTSSQIRYNHTFRCLTDTPFVYQEWDRFGDDGIQIS